MTDVARIFALTSPLFALVLVGYLLSRFGGWPKSASDALTRFVFSVAIPAFLFRLMSDFASLPHVDARLLPVYFGGCLVVYALACVGGYRMQRVGEFYALAIVIGLVQGGVQSLSRSFFARLIPADKSAEFFGFYNMLGKFAAILGPILMGAVALWTGSPNERSFDEGRRLLRGWLAMTALDLYGCPISSATDDPASCARLRQVAGLAPETPIILALRIGPTESPYLSPRLGSAASEQL